jgi:DnaK suppressor protein
MNDLDVDVPRQTYKPDPKLANAWKSKAGRELTEEEILAMPESEYMNEKQLEFFRYRLQQLKDDLLSNAGETTEHLREDTTIVPDPADRATIEEEHALELRTRDRERKLLKKISQSLARIDSGEYGFPRLHSLSRPSSGVSSSRRCSATEGDHATIADDRRASRHCRAAAGFSIGWPAPGRRCRRTATRGRPPAH